MKQVETALGRKFNPSRTYVIAEKGRSFASKINKGYEKVGSIGDDLSILVAPKPESSRKSGGILNRTSKGKNK